jgi:hypothetical protein
MRGFQNLNAPGRGELPVTGNDDAREIDVAPSGVQCRRHCNRGLAGAYHHTAAFRLLRQVPEKGSRWIGAGNRSVKDVAKDGTRRYVGPAGG